MNCNNFFQGNNSCWLILLVLFILLVGNSGCGCSSGCGCESASSSGCGCSNRCCD